MFQDLEKCIADKIKIKAKRDSVSALTRNEISHVFIYTRV